MQRYLFPFLALLVSCSRQPRQDAKSPIEDTTDKSAGGISLVILGTVQDGGSPHIGCNKDCCKDLFSHPDPSRKVVSLGLIDYEQHKIWLLEAGPDLSTQLKDLNDLASPKNTVPDGIFLTHAHIGHYAGLMYLGREAMGAKEIPVYVMPRMRNFLENNGPWSQLVALNNIVIHNLFADSCVALGSNLSITSFTVPHRDEFSETLGFKIMGPKKSVLFIPDIDKWAKWGRDIVKEIAEVDYAFIDATFFNGEEINNRDISEIPHPFVVESMHLFKDLTAEEKNKIHFIHFNHTNPLLNSNSEAYREVESKGFHVSEKGMEFQM